MKALATLEAGILCGLVRALTGVTARGVLPSEADRRPFVFFANHSSHLDAVVLWLSLPPALRRRTRPVAARDYWERSAVRRHFACAVLDALLIDRGDASGQPNLRAAANAMHAMVTALEGGASLILFPEGTRGSGEEMGSFKSGLYQLAKRVPTALFVPAYLENLNRILPKGEWLPVPLLGAVRFGEPLQRQEDEDKAGFLDRCWRALQTLKEAAG